MISLAILAVALVAISDLNGTAVQMHYYARRATQATLLLRGKMLDLEEQLHKDGFHDFDDEKHGTFEEEGAPEYAWKAEILKPEMSLDEGALLGMLGLGGSTGSTSASSSGSKPGSNFDSALASAASGLSSAGITSAQGLRGAGLQALGPMAGLLQAQAKTFIETLKKSVREVRVSITWKDGANERSISASQQIVILPESVGKAGLTSGQKSAPGDGTGDSGATGRVPLPRVLGQPIPIVPPNRGDPR